MDEKEENLEPQNEGSNPQEIEAPPVQSEFEPGQALLSKIPWKPIVGVLAIILILWFANGYGAKKPKDDASNAKATPQIQQTEENSRGGWNNLRRGIGSGRRAYRVQTNIGFTSEQSLTEHFEKHGHEFGVDSEEQYLTHAQEFRDRPKYGYIREDVRSDGVHTRYDRRNDWFIAYNEDLTIRTFFIPNDGEEYYDRQLNR